MPKKKTRDLKGKLMKVVYFDEGSARDYIDIRNGGQYDWSTTENKEKLAKMLVEIEAQAKGGFNILSVLKATLAGNANTSYDSNTSNLIESSLTNTLLTDYIAIASDDKNIRQFFNDGVYAPKDSISMYKIYSSYLTIVPKEQIPIDLEKLNEAVLGERGYYQMLLNSENEPTCVLRFNIKAFKNNYNLADLSKMKLTYFGVKVGSCTQDQLTMEKEFENEPQKNKLSAKDILSDSNNINSDELEVYDIVLAGVMCE